MQLDANEVRSKLGLPSDTVVQFLGNYVLVYRKGSHSWVRLTRDLEVISAHYAEEDEEKIS
jgi:hypothetical protein